jgi:hypothetical protein
MGEFTDGAVNGSANGQAPSRAASGPAELPDREPDRMWGGPSPGGRCAVCRSTLRRGELEIEVEFRRNGDFADADRYRVHVDCFSVWQAAKSGGARTERSKGGASSR